MRHRLNFTRISTVRPSTGHLLSGALSETKPKQFGLHRFMTLVRDRGQGFSGTLKASWSGVKPGLGHANDEPLGENNSPLRSFPSPLTALSIFCYAWSRLTVLSVPISVYLILRVAVRYRKGDGQSNKLNDDVLLSSYYNVESWSVQGLLDLEN